ncbi:MAG: hypothetical protein KGD74_10080 [Candidatus Lokiarchaeota archaeon]|nr:hypothetical protein [Candidatus Lokiarchaeota archaeon]
MNTKTQKRTKYLACILFVLCLLHTVVIGYSLEPSHGRESTNQQIPIYFLWWIIDYKTANSVADVQGHMVYDNSGNAGYEGYAVFLYGKNTFSSSKISVKIYVTALYEEKVSIIPTGQYIERTYWGPPPIDFITWDGDMGYGATTPGVWQYNVGITLYGYTFGYTYTSAAYYDAYPQVNPPIVEGIYRNMGYLNSIYDNGGHEFKACVRLQVHNNVANLWGSGVVNYNPGVYYAITRILSMRVKVIFKFYHNDNSLQATHTHLMGDGVNPDNNDIDINQIPLAVGSCYYS